MNENNRVVEELQESPMLKAMGKDTISKIDRYKWTKAGEPGTMILVDKDQLSISLDYQREATSRQSVLRIARNFDWAKFGVLIVSETKDGFYVMDGGHRLRAALLRDDVKSVPCVIFEMGSVSSEAAAFYGINNDRRVVTPYEKHKSALCSAQGGIPGFEMAVKADKIIRKHGYEFTGSSAKLYECTAIITIYNMVRKNSTLADIAVDILAKIAEGLPLRNEELKGLFYLLQNNPSIDFYGFPLDNMASAGLEQVRKDIRQKVLMVSGNGNYIVMAAGMLKIINKGRSKNKVMIPV